MTLLLVVAALLAVLEDDFLLAQTVIHDFPCHFGARNERETDLDGVAICREEDLVEIDLDALAAKTLDVLNGKDVAFFDDILVGARLDDRYLCHMKFYCI